MPKPMFSDEEVERALEAYRASLDAKGRDDDTWEMRQPMAIRAALATLTLPANPELTAARERLEEAAAALKTAEDEDDGSISAGFRRDAAVLHLTQAARAYAALAGRKGA